MPNASVTAKAARLIFALQFAVAVVFFFAGPAHEAMQKTPPMLGFWPHMGAFAALLVALAMIAYERFAPGIVLLVFVDLLLFVAKTTSYPEHVVVHAVMCWWDAVVLLALRMLFHRKDASGGSAMPQS
jgi:hypothetical protein